MRQTINLRLALIALIAIIASTAGTTAVFYRIFKRQVSADLKINAEMLRDTGLFQNLYAAAGGRKEAVDINALQGLEHEKVRITWIDGAGEVLYDNDVSGLQNHLDRPEIRSALERGAGESVRNSDTMNMNTYYYAVHLDDGTILRLSTQAYTISRIFLEAAPIVLLILGLTLATCILIGHLLSASIMEPVKRMAEQFEEQEDGSVTGGQALTYYKELEPFVEKIRIQHENILAAAKSRQDFTANVSHELKTPLTAISGYAELLENHLADPGQEEHIARQIRSNAERLLALINDIIRLSELDHKELPRQYVPVDLSEVTELCCDNLRVYADQKKVNLEYRGDPVTVTADKDLLRELTENIIRNAVQYNREGGFVKVYAGTENGRPILRVTDDGIGIAKDQQERIFERFYRVDKSRSRASGGTGLGLAIVKHIAQLHEAEICVESEPGKGTEISVIF